MQRGRVRLVAGALVVVVLASIRIATVSGAAHSSPSVVVSTIDVGTHPFFEGLAGDGNTIWAATERKLLVVDARRDRVVRRLSLSARIGDATPSPVGELIAVAGSIWAPLAQQDGVTIVRIDPHTGRTVAEVPLASSDPLHLCSPGPLMDVGGAVWVVVDCDDKRLYRIDPQSNAVTATTTVFPFEGDSQTGVAPGPDAIWLSDEGSRLWTVDPETTSVSGGSAQTLPSFRPVSAIKKEDQFELQAGNDSALWATRDIYQGHWPSKVIVMRIDPTTKTVVRHRAFSRAGLLHENMIYGDDELWALEDAANLDYGGSADEVLRVLDPTTLTTRAQVTLTDAASGSVYLFHAHSLWVAGYGKLLRARIDRPGR